MDKMNACLYQDIVIRLLSRMDKGQLELLLPNGRRLTIGNDPSPIQARLRIRDAAFFKRCILYGDIGFGEAYMDGLWDTEDITAVVSWFLLNVDQTPGLSGSRSRSILVNLLQCWNRLRHSQCANTLPGSRRIIAQHYDLNNDFFRLFLDPTMTYSGAYFRRDGMDLEEAQEAKYERLCEQLRLRPDDHVLEIGSGWGGNAIYMAQNYGCRVTSLTISKQQHELATRRVKAAGLEQQVTILLEDYRNFKGRFDKIVSVEMLESVGHRYLKNYFRKCNGWLKQDGILALQVITCPDSRYDSLLPSVKAINTAVNATGEMTLVDLKDLGLHYAATLKIWFLQFNSRRSDVRALGFDEHFIRKWNYYLCYCEAAFRMRNIHVMQLVYTRPNNLTR